MYAGIGWRFGLIAGPCEHSSTPAAQVASKGWGDRHDAQSRRHGYPSFQFTWDSCVLDTRSNLRGDSVLETSDQLRAPRAVLGGQASVPGFQVMSAPAYGPRPVACCMASCRCPRLTPTPVNKIQGAEIRRAGGRLVSSTFNYGILFNF